MRTKNPVARSLKLRRFRLKIVKPRKGKGSYRRKGRTLPFSMWLFLLIFNIDSQGVHER
jgi:stalled ribosome alternative rescue factor ArfA